MIPLDMLQIIWFILIGVLFVGYSILDGFDLGTGILQPFLAKDEKDTKVLFNAIGPVWDGNEVWLLTGAGALFAAFPFVYASVFSGFYTAMMLLLCAMIFRAVSMEFWSLDQSSRALWKITFFFGSLITSILLGVALGNVIVGIPLNESGDFTGNFFTLLRPFPLAVGILGLAAILSQGATYLMLKTTGELKGRAVKAAEKIWIFYSAAFVIALTLSFLYIPQSRVGIIPWIFTALTLISIAALRFFIVRGSDPGAFIASSSAFLSLWGITGSILFPVLVVSTGPGQSLTIINSSSSQMTLMVMLIFALIGMPIVIGYTVYIYKIFKGRENA